MNPSKSGKVGAVMLGGAHVLWSVLVLFGWAQPLVDFSMWAHMVENGPSIASFDATAAVTLILVASAIGYGAGYIFSTVWHKVHRS